MRIFEGYGAFKGNEHTNKGNYYEKEILASILDGATPLKGFKYSECNLLSAKFVGLYID